MLDFLKAIFSVEPFVPHGHCYLWKTGLVGLHISADALIALAYYSIPIALFYFVRQRSDLPFKRIFLLFAAFIISCGTSHILEIWTLWYPAYWFSGSIKAITALISVITAIELVPVIPKVLALPSPAKLQRLNQELQISQMRSAGILEVASDAIISIDDYQRITLFNRAAENIFGYTAKEALGQPLSLLLPQKIAVMHHQHINNFREGNTRIMGERSEIFGRRKNGAEFPAEASISTLVVAGERISTAFLRDITEHKQAETQLQEQQRFLRQVIDINPSLICVKNWDGEFTLANQALAEVYDTTTEAIVGKTDADLCINPTEAAAYVQADRQVMQTLEPLVNFEENITTAKGAVRRLQTTKKPLVSPDGQTRQVLCVANDITALKQAEAALQQKTEELEAFFSSTLDLLCIANTKGYFLRLNPEWEQTLGYSLPELEGRRFLDFVHPDDLEATLTATAQLSRQQTILNFVNRYRHQDGSYRWLEWRTSSRESYIYAAVRDITARRQAEQALQEREAFLRAIGDNIPNGFVYQLMREQDGRYRFTYVSAGIEQLNGLKPEAVMADASLIFNFLVEDDLPYVLQQQEESAQNLSLFDVQVRERLPNSGIRWLRLCSTPRRLEDGRVIWDGVRLDINDLKQTEESLRQSEERWHLAISGSNDGIWDHNLQTNTHYLSPRCMEILGYEYDEIDTFDKWLQLVHPDDTTRLQAKFQMHVEQYLPNYACEYRMLCKDGSYKWLLARGQVLWDEQGNPLRAVGSLTDITDRKQVEEALQLTDFSFESSSISAAWIKPDASIMRVNAAACRSLGYSREELQSMHVYDLDPNFPVERWPEHWQELKQQKHLSFVTQQCTKDGRLLPVEVTLNYVEFNGEEYNFASMQDISNRLQAEAVLRESEERFRSAFDYSAIGMAIVSLDGRWLKVNAALCEIVGYSEEELFVLTFQDLTHPDDLATDLAYVQQLLAGEIRTYQLEKRYLHKQGQIVWILLTGSLVRNSRNEPLYLIGQVQDVTERKRAEERLRQSENTKRAMIQAIPDLLIRMRNDGTQLELINHGCVNLIIGEGEVSGSNVRDILPPDVVRERLRYAEQALQTNEVQFQEYQLTIDSELYYEEARLVALQENEVLIMVRDITDRKRMEQSLRESEVQFRTLIEDLQVGVVVHGVQSEILLCNSKALDLLGLSEAQLLGRTSFDPDWNVIHENGSPFFSTDHPSVRAIATGRSVRNVIMGVYRPQHNDRIWLLVDAEPRLGDKGDVQQVICTFSDISDRQAALRERERAEERLRRYERIVAAATDGIALVDCNYTYQVVNQAFLDWQRKSKEQIVGHPISEVLGTALFEAKIKERLDRCLAGEVVQYELWMEYPTLGLQFMSVTYAPYFEPNRTISGVVVSLRNLTELRQAEEQLRQSEERLRLALKAAKFGTWKYNFVTNELLQSDISEIYGLEPGQTHNTYEEWKAQVHPDDHDWMQAEFDRAIQEAGEFSFEFRIVRPDKTVCWALSTGTVIHNQSGQPLYAYGIAANITERKQAEVEEKAQQAFLRQVIDTVPNIIFVKNKGGRILVVNQAGAEAHGTTVEAMLGKREPDFNPNFSPEQLREFLAINHQVMRTRQPHTNLAESIVDATGKTCWYQTVINPLVDVHGQVVGIVGATTDVTELKQAQQALQQAKEAAEAANKAKSIFLANMSHELRTPLNVILGFAQVMHRDEKLTSEQRESLQIIRRSGDHLLSLINDVLDLSKIEAGHIALDEDNVDIIDLLQSIEQMLRQRAETKALQLHLELAPNLPQYVTIDANKLRQVLINLLGNAIKFTHQGHVTLRVKAAVCNREAEASEQQSFHSSISLTFEVADTGVGIGSTELNSIFKAFVQTQAGKFSPEGTGLGLTISQKFVQMMGGNITVQSTLGYGSTFAFTIPVRLTQLANVAAAAVSCQVIGLAPNQPIYRILVVDDQPENRQLLVKLLTSIGLDVKEATNGQEAVTQWQQWQPHLIYMDVRMPLLDGYEATRQIRATSNGQAPVIIALTAQASQNDRVLALVSGCNDYLSKPFQEEVLFSKMAEHLGVKYLCAAETDTSNTDYNSTITLHPSDLSGMPSGWIAELRQAARLCDDGEIEELIEHIPAEQASLIKGLRHLVQGYNFKQIIALTTSESTKDNS